MPTRKALLVAAAAIALLFVAYNAVFNWPAARQAQAKQERLIAAIEARKWGRVSRLTSEGYKDSLELDRDGLVLALQDVGSLFFGPIDLHWEMIDLQPEGDTIVITGKLRITGDGPGAAAVMNYARPFAEKPFTFRWQKTGLLPWTWQLESAEHPDARLPTGYTPGDVRRRISAGEF